VDDVALCGSRALTVMMAAGWAVRGLVRRSLARRPGHLERGSSVIKEPGGVVIGLGVDAEGLRAAEGDVGVEGELLALGEPQPWIPPGQFLQRQPGFQAA